MFTVIVTEKGGDQKRLHFDKPEVTIGRVQGNDIILPKSNVSKRHSRIVLKDGKYIVVDLKSTNGTYVNGRKITSPLIVKDTDKIYIGDFILTVGEEATVGAGAIDDVPDAPSLDDDDDGPPSVTAGGQTAPPPPRRLAPATGEPRVAIPPPPRRPVSEPVELDEDQDSIDEGVDGGVAAADAHLAEVEDLQELPGPPSVDDEDDDIPASPPQRITARLPTKPPTSTQPPSGPPPAEAPRAPRTPTVPPSSGRTPSSGTERPGVRLAGAGARPATLRPSAPVPPAVASPAPQAAVADATLAQRRGVVDRLIGELDTEHLAADRLADPALRSRAETLATSLARELGADSDVGAAVAEAIGLGPLEALLADEEITDIRVDRPDRIRVARRGQFSLHPDAFSSERALRLATSRLLARAGRADDRGPLVDARLPDGSRLTAVLPPVAVRGSCLTLRKAARHAPTVDELVDGGMLSRGMADFLRVCVQARRNLLVCGGPGSGKTSLLRALAAGIPGGERVVSIEEVAELALGREEGWIALEASPPAVGMVDLLRTAARLGADRLIVDEVRGAEAFELCTSMASAHEGALVGLVAEGPRSALARLETLARLSAGDASPRGLRELVGSAVHVIVGLARQADGSRRVASIVEVSGLDGDSIAVRELFSYRGGRFAGAGVVPRFYEILEERGIPSDPAIFR